MERMSLIVALCALLSSVSVSSWELSGSDITVLTGEKAMLRCDITIPADAGSATVHKVWKDSSDEVLFFKSTPVQADKERMNVTLTEDSMTLVISDVALTDENVYKCGLNGISPPLYQEVNLTVNQYPQEFYVTDYGVEPIEGVETSVAGCFVKGAKPEPVMWFTDSDGNEVDVSEDITVTPRENGVVDGALSLKFTFTKSNHNMVYKCNVQRADDTVDTRELSGVKVRHEPTANLKNANPGEHKVMEEGGELEVTCTASGYPEPNVLWTFQPDEDTNITAEEYWPNNFARTNGGRTIRADVVEISGQSTTNNGTFICKVSNGIGSLVSRSFHLEVYAMPITTVPTTPDVTTKRPEATAAAAPRSAGSDGAVIGGVVAVAAFVLIVAVILIARYFMSHKGTYHTNELKSGDADEEKMSDDHLMDGDDDEDIDLSRNKRTEYFM